MSWFQAEARRARRELEASRRQAAVRRGAPACTTAPSLDDLDIPGQWPEVAAELEASPTRPPPLPTRRARPRRRVADGPRTAGGWCGRSRSPSEVGGGSPLRAWARPLPADDVGRSGCAVDRGGDRGARRGAVRSAAGGGIRRRGRTARRPSRRAGPARPRRRSATGSSSSTSATRPPLDECRRAAISRIRRFATRQERWFRRDPRVVWLDADRRDLALAVWSA